MRNSDACTFSKKHCESHGLSRNTSADGRDHLLPAGLEAIDGSPIAYAKDAVLSKGVLFASPKVDAPLKQQLRDMYAAIARR